MNAEINNQNQSLEALLESVSGCDGRALRGLLGQFATGVTVITACTPDGRLIGMTANSFSSVSLEPAMVLWCLAKNAPSLNDFVSSSHFAINILRADQEDISGQFARPSDNKFAGVDYQCCDAGVPVLNDAVATLVCRNHTQYEGGDHLIMLGEIEHFRHEGGEPLLFHGGRYRNLATRSASVN